MDLIHHYPVAFFVTVVLPLVTGVVLALGGYESLRARAASDAQLNRIEKNSEEVRQHLPEVSGTIATLNRYEASLAAAGERDEVLARVLAQYEQMQRANDVLALHRGTKDLVDQLDLASEVLDVLQTNLAPVAVSNSLPGNPLILHVGMNTFRVLFAVPMRIAPNLEFQQLPEGVEAEVKDKSRFGFTVRFTPENIPVAGFAFSADAEL